MGEKTLKKIVIFSLAVFFIIAGFIVFGLDTIFSDMFNLPIGELVAEETSPDGSYTVKAYVSRPEEAIMVDDGVLGRLFYNNSLKIPKNIYWSYHESEAKITWIDNETVVINGHELDVFNDTYDWRDD